MSQNKLRPRAGLRIRGLRRYWLNPTLLGWPSQLKWDNVISSVPVSPLETSQLFAASWPSLEEIPASSCQLIALLLIQMNRKSQNVEALQHPQIARKVWRALRGYPCHVSQQKCFCCVHGRFWL